MLNLKNNAGGWSLASIHTCAPTYRREHVHTHIYTQTKRHIKANVTVPDWQCQALVLSLEETADLKMGLENLFLFCFVFVTNNGTVFHDLNPNQFWCSRLSCVCLQLRTWLIFQILRIEGAFQIKLIKWYSVFPELTEFARAGEAGLTLNKPLSKGSNSKVTRVARAHLLGLKLQLWGWVEMCPFYSLTWKTR